MKFLVDAQLPPALARFIESKGHEACAVREVGLREATDAAIWAYAEQGHWIIVTKDEDFVQRVLLQATGPRVVWLRIGNSTKRALIASFEPLFANALRELEAGERLIELKSANGRGEK